MVTVFDTAFHQTIPEERYLYPIPYRYYDKFKVRKYGFHGTSHSYVSKRVAEVIGKKLEDLKIIVCHIGQGASLCAVQGGKSVDTSMGLTPLGGIMMCARSGDLDPSIVTFLMKKENLSSDEMDRILNKESGAFGISGISPYYTGCPLASGSHQDRRSAPVRRLLLQWRPARKFLLHRQARLAHLLISKNTLFGHCHKKQRKK